jgi:hypothetical protein
MTDLTDRMRTCAAYLLTTQLMRDYDAVRDATDLLIEASNALEAIPPPLGEPMEILKALPATATPAFIDPPEKLVEQYKTVATWFSGHDTLPPPSGKPSPRPNRVCPECDSRAVKKVYREGSLLMLACPVCGAGWEYKP